MNSKKSKKRLTKSVRKSVKKVNAGAKKKSSARARARSGAGDLVLAYDLGGTKVAVGVLDRRGRIIESVREPVHMAAGPQGLIDQLANWGRIYLKKYPSISRAGLGSAGPLDPMAGVLLNATNFITDGKHWGQVPIVGMLSKKLRIPVFLDNDAAAAMLAEELCGGAKGQRNAMILTLGTGLGTGIIANGELVRAGRWLHPEAGHVIIRGGDPTAPCGCGNLGCAEAFLSGRNFGLRAHRVHGLPTIAGSEVAALARAGDARARRAFDEYAELMAVAIRTYVVLYAPEVIVLGGSFARAADLFIERTKEHLVLLLESRRVGIDMFPHIVISPLEESGLIGAASIAFRRAAKS